MVQWDDILPAYFADPKFSPPAELKGLQMNYDVTGPTLSALGQYNITQEIAKITVPATVTYGDSEPFGLAMGQNTHKALTGTTAKWVLLKACGHFWQECEQAFFAELRALYKLGSP